MRHIILAFMVVCILSCGAGRLSKRDALEFSKLKEKEIAEKALSFFNEKKYDKSIATYQLILAKKKPDRKYAAWAAYEIGFCYYYQKQFKKAAEYFEKVRKEYSDQKGPYILSLQLLDKIKRKKTEGV